MALMREWNTFSHRHRRSGEGSQDRDEDRRRGEWESTPSRRTAEDEWEMTPSRDRGRSATPSGRPFSSSHWDFSSSPALTPVRAGSKGNNKNSPTGSRKLVQSIQRMQNKAYFTKLSQALFHQNRQPASSSRANSFFDLLRCIQWGLQSKKPHASIFLSMDNQSQSSIFCQRKGITRVLIEVSCLQLVTEGNQAV